MFAESPKAHGQAQVHKRGELRLLRLRDIFTAQMDFPKS